MTNPALKGRAKEWAARYIPAEIVGTGAAVIAAGITYGQSHSYLTAAASGWAGEGIGFYGYFINAELLLNAKKYQNHAFYQRIGLAAGVASTNLFVEFAPAEIFDNVFIRPFAMYIVPQYIHPYPVGFLMGKFAADAVFYLLAIGGYEVRKRWLKG